MPEPRPVPPCRFAPDTGVFPRTTHFREKCPGILFPWEKIPRTISHCTGDAGLMITISGVVPMRRSQGRFEVPIPLVM